MAPFEYFTLDPEKSRSENLLGIASESRESFGRRSKLMDELYADDNSLDMNQGITTALLGLAPILAGLAVGGYEGGAMGAKAGTEGAGLYLKDVQEDDKNRKLRAQNGLEFEKEYGKDLSTKASALYKDEQTSKEFAPGGIKDVFEGRKIDRATAAHNVRREFDAAHPLASSGGKKELSPEEIEAQTAVLMKQNPSLSYDDAKTRVRGGWEFGQVLHTAGANTKRPGSEEVTQLAASRQLEYPLKKMQEYHKAMSEEDIGGLRRLLESGKLTSAYVKPNSPAARFVAWSEAVKKSVARMYDSGQLSTIDVEMFAPITQGNMFYMDTAARELLLKEIGEFVASRGQAIRGTLEQGGRNIGTTKDEEFLKPDQASALNNGELDSFGNDGAYINGKYFDAKQIQNLRQKGVIR